MALDDIRKAAKKEDLVLNEKRCGVKEGGIDVKMFESYLSGITDMEKRARMAEILKWVSAQFPGLEPRFAWNQPMFTDHGTFIIGFSMSKQHIAVSPEKAGIDHFLTEIENVGYGHGTNLFRIKWSDSIDYTLLEKVIAFNREDKSDCSSFWRK